MATSKIEGFGLFLRSVAASEEVLLRAMAPSLDEENFDDVYDVKMHIKHGDNRGVTVLGWPEFDVNNKGCAIESTRAAAFSLVNHSDNPNCALEVRGTYTYTYMGLEIDVCAVRAYAQITDGFGS